MLDKLSEYFFQIKLIKTMFFAFGESLKLVPVAPIAVTLLWISLAVICISIVLFQQK